MPKTRDERLENANSLLNQRVNQLEAIIEKKLDQEYEGKEIFIGIADLEREVDYAISTIVIQKLVERYAEAGYKVSYETDRDTPRGWIKIEQEFNMITIYFNGSYWYVLEDFDEYILLQDIDTVEHWKIFNYDVEWSDVQDALEDAEFQLFDEI